MLKRIQHIKEYSEQFRYTMASMYESTILIQQHKLWAGFWKYGWVSRFLVVVAIILGLKMLNSFSAITDLLSSQSASQALNSMGSMIQSSAESAYQVATDSSTKYIMLILLEVVIFHACRKTLTILGHDAEAATFKNFLNAQLRMLLVGMFAWAMSLGISIPVKIVLGIIEPLKFLETPIIYLIESFFLGFAVVDNFNEQFSLKIQESYKFSLNYMGVVLAIGLAVNLLLLIPLLGAIAAPLIAAVTATVVLYEETRQGALAREHIRLYRKKKKK